MPGIRHRLLASILLLVVATAPVFAGEGDEGQSLLGWRSGKDAQQADRSQAENRLAPLVPLPSSKAALTNNPHARDADPLTLAALSPATTLPDKPLALLVRNPTAESGAPPFALADDQGRIQRFVEPTTSIPLDRFVGQVVRVNHDTGQTLLASQLDLPTTDSPPRVLVLPVQHTSGEALPEPIVLEEVVGEPEGPLINGLQFPDSLQPAPAATPSPAMSSSAPAACVGCGAVVSGPYGQPTCGPNCPLAGVRWALPHGKLDFGVDALLLRTHDSAAANGGEDFEFGTRWEVGFSPSWGKRVALRYLEYDTGLAAGPMDVELLDLESQLWFPAGGAQIGIGGGLRWAEYEEAGGLTYSDTIGPVVGVYGRAPAFWNTDGIFTLRQSFQFGDAGAADRGTFGITELQFGLEHRRRIAAGEGFVRGFFETQYWNDVGQTATDSTSRGLIGFGLGAGFRR
ncbi:MAG: hypothetical protein AAF589_02060 [Planctomycetota bacterium]